MRKLFRDLSPGQFYAMQVQSIRYDGLRSDWSQTFRFQTDGDATAPGVVTGLTWAPTGSSFIAKWTKPAFDADGGALLDFKDYRVIVSALGIDKTYYLNTETFELTLDMNANIFGDIAYTVGIEVRARDQTLNLSAPVTATATEDTPPVPSTPILSIYLGQINVKWDGNPATGVRNALSLEHVEIHASTTTGFTPSESTMVGRFNGLFPGPQEQMIKTSTYGTPVYVKLVSVNRTGRKSTPSAQASATPVRITGLDIQDGQISTAEINFTAFDIGGANAYYQTAAPSGGTIKDGDIWYDTDDSYKAYRRTAGAWVLDSNIGVIAGTKILAGTLTAAAVGTNLLITAAANIGTAVIDYTKIGSVDAGTMTVGTLKSSATVSYGGTPARPTWSFSTTGDGELNNVNVRGQLVVGNSGDTSGVRAASVVRSYDYLANTAGWSIKGDGSVEFNNGTFRGAIEASTMSAGTITGTWFRTAASGSRISIGASGAIRSIQFYSTTGTSGDVSGYTATTAAEGIIMRWTIAGSASNWNVIGVQDSEFTYLSSRLVTVIMGGATTGSRGFTVDYAPDKTDIDSGRVGILNVLPDSVGIYVNLAPSAGNFNVADRNDANRSRILVANDGWNYFYHRPGGGTAFYSRVSSSSTTNIRFFFDEDVFAFRWANFDFGRIEYTAPTSGAYFYTPRMVLANEINYGVTLFAGVSTGGANHHMRVMDAGASVYIPLWAASFIISSSRETKIDEQEISLDESMELVRATNPKKFRRQRGTKLKDAGKKATFEDRIEIGVIAEDLPDEFRVDAETGPMWDVGPTVAATLGGLKHVDLRLVEDQAKIKQLEDRIKELEKKIK